MSEKIIYDIVYGVVRRAIESEPHESVDEVVQSLVVDIVDSVNVAAGDAQYVASKITGGDAPWPDLQRPIGQHRGN